jgi:putative aminopeptidase FrvX
MGHREGAEEELPSSLKEIALALTKKPTAPYFEGAVCSTVRKFLTGKPGISVGEDPFGNLRVRYAPPGRRQPALRLFFVAHMDHPGLRAVRGNPSKARVLGGVSSLLLPGTRVIWYGKDYLACGTAEICRVEQERTGKLWVFLDRIPERSVFGTWDLGAPCFRTGSFYALACDDLVGVATLVWLLLEASQNRFRLFLEVLLTRAEEVGLRGARFAARHLSREEVRSPILSLEASRASGWAEYGGGFVLRVGDRRSIFPPAVTQWLLWACEHARESLPRLRYQRRLLGGGTCEATAFLEQGYPSGGFALPLAHYHNEGRGPGLSRERVSLADWSHLAAFLLWWAGQGERFSWQRWCRTASKSLGSAFFLSSREARGALTLRREATT